MASRTYIGTARDYSTGPAHTFAAQDIGTPAAGRVMGVIVHAFVAANCTSFALTIDGISADRDGISLQNIGDYTLATAIFSLAVPSGTAADLEVTTDVDMVDCYIHVYAMEDVDAASATNDDNAYGTGGSGATYDISVNVPDGAIVIAGAQYRENFSLTAVSWTGVTQDGSNSNTYDLLNSAASHVSSAAETPRTISAAVIYEGGNRFAGVVVVYPAATIPPEPPKIDDQTQIDIGPYGAKSFYSDGAGHLFTL